MPTEKTGLRYGTLYNRIFNYGFSIEEAVLKKTRIENCLRCGIKIEIEKKRNPKYCGSIGKKTGCAYLSKLETTRNFYLKSVKKL